MLRHLYSFSLSIALSLLFSGGPVWASDAASTCEQLVGNSKRHSSPLILEFDRATPEVKAYFGGQIGNGILDPKHLLSDLLKQKSEAQEALRFFSRAGKKYVSAREISERHMSVFREILKLKSDQLRFLNSYQMLELLHTFAHWNLLPPHNWSQNLQLQLAETIPSWKKVDFHSFAILRKLSPMKFHQFFLNKLKPTAVQHFSSWSLNNKLEFLSGELLQGEYYSVRELAIFLQDLTSHLGLLPESTPARAGLLKDVYRGLISFRAREPGVLSPLTTELEAAIEQHLQRSGLSLAQGGPSGYNNTPRTNSDDRLMEFERELGRLIPDLEFRKEWMDTSVAGFFDPADYFYPQLHLVVEWDGLHHYFRKVAPSGDLPLTKANLVLRPIDQAKDRALKALGFTVVRVTPLDQDLGSRLNTILSAFEKSSD